MTRGADPANTGAEEGCTGRLRHLQSSPVGAGASEPVWLDTISSVSEPGSNSVHPKATLLANARPSLTHRALRTRLEKKLDSANEHLRPSLRRSREPPRCDVIAPLALPAQYLESSFSPSRGAVPGAASRCLICARGREQCTCSLSKQSRQLEPHWAGPSTGNSPRGRPAPAHHTLFAVTSSNHGLAPGW